VPQEHEENADTPAGVDVAQKRATALDPLENSIGRQRNCERKIGSFGEPPSALPIEAELRIADQYFSSAKERSPAINVRGYRGGSSQRGTKIISHTVLRIIKRAARPLALGAWLQTPNYREAAEVPLP